MKLSFIFETKDYIGDYVQEYRNAGLLKAKSAQEALKEREENLSGDKVSIKENNRFRSFVLLQASSENEVIESKYIASISDYKRVMRGIRHIGYMNRSDYEKTEKVLSEKIVVRKVDEDLSHLKQYINEFALIVMYARNRCFTEWELYSDKLQSVLSDSEKRKIRNFYDEMTRAGVDIDKITVKCNNREENLKINSPILIKMMLYSFAREYFTFVEKADKEHWEEQMVFYTYDDTQAGRRKKVDWKNITALIKVFFDFMDSIGVFNEKTTEGEKCLIIGRLLTVAGFEKYDENKEEHINYDDEIVYYRLRVNRLIRK